MRYWRRMRTLQCRARSSASRGFRGSPECTPFGAQCRAAWRSSHRNPLAGRHGAPCATRAPVRSARSTHGSPGCGVQQTDYFASYDLRCSSKKARTCSGSSAPRNSTPAGSGSGKKTLSGVGIFGGFASMIILLYKPIIGLGPRCAPAPDACNLFFVALTAQRNNSTASLNRIYRFTPTHPVLAASRKTGSTRTSNRRLPCW
jgi:hypothetical protein